MSDQRIFTNDAFPVTASVAPGFVPGTRLLTSEGYLEVERLAVGDRLLTRRGVKRIASLEATRSQRADWTYTRHRWPIRVPVGSLGNCRPMRLSPEQRVLLSGGTVQRICKVSEISVCVRDLVGLRGVIVERPLAELRYLGLSFGLPVVIEAEGVPCEIDSGEAAIVPGDMARRAFQAMHAVGEPPLKR